MEMTDEQIEAHNQEMINRAEANDARAEDAIKTDEERLLAGKYKSVEDLEKAYSELQSKLGQRQEETEAQPEEAPSQEEAKETVEQAGLNFDAMYEEYSTNNGLSQATYDSLAKAGISKEVVDNYIAGQEAIQQSAIDSIVNEVGGTQSYQDMVEWAASNLTEAEQNAFNNSLNDEASARFAVQGLYARFRTANPSLIGGNRTGGQNVNRGGYATKSEMMKDMSSREYKMDSTFRAEVQRKVALSNFL